MNIEMQDEAHLIEIRDNLKLLTENYALSSKSLTRATCGTIASR